MDNNNEKDTIYIVTDELPTTRGRYFCVYGHGYKDGITWDGREADINWAKNLNAKFLKEISKEELAALQPSTLPLIEDVDERIKRLLAGNPIHFFLVNILRYTTPEQMKEISDCLIERLPKSVPLIDKGSEAIAFAEWIANNLHTNENYKGYFLTWAAQVRTPTEVYELFKNKKQ